jgi:hypothetical protein
MTQLFSAKALLDELAHFGLRVAQQNEAGWWYRAWCGTKIWVCEVKLCPR